MDPVRGVKTSRWRLWQRLTERATVQLTTVCPCLLCRSQPSPIIVPLRRNSETVCKPGISTDAKARQFIGPKNSIDTETCLLVRVACGSYIQKRGWTIASDVLNAYRKTYGLLNSQCRAMIILQEPGDLSDCFGIPGCRCCPVSHNDRSDRTCAACVLRIFNIDLR